MTNIKQLQVLNGSHLKIIAIFSMIIDHIAYYFRSSCDFFSISLLNIANHDITIYFVMRTLGRIAFPIFAFLIVEGFINTRNRFKYGKNLLIFALLSELPWNLAHNNSLIYVSQNVFFTLLLGFIAINCIDKYKENKPKMALYVFSLFIVSIILRADYGCFGFGYIIMMYLLRNNIVHMSIVGCCALPTTWRSGLAFIPISMYNGQRGFVKGLFWKYSFYVIYPLHLLIIWFVKYYC